MTADSLGSLVKEFEAYPFSDDPNFRAGLPTVMAAIKASGKERGAAEIDEMIGRAQWFYFTNNPIPATAPAFTSPRPAPPPPMNAPCPPSRGASHMQGLATLESLAQARRSLMDQDKNNDGTTSGAKGQQQEDLGQCAPTADANIGSVTGTEPEQSGATKAPLEYMDFATVAKMIAEGRAEEVPVNHIPEGVNDAPASQPTMSSRRKPWEAAIPVTSTPTLTSSFDHLILANPDSQPSFQSPITNTMSSFPMQFEQVDEGYQLVHGLRQPDATATQYDSYNPGGLPTPNPYPYRPINDQPPRSDPYTSSLAFEPVGQMGGPSHTHVTAQYPHFELYSPVSSQPVQPSETQSQFQSQSQPQHPTWSTSAFRQNHDNAYIPTQIPSDPLVPNLLTWDSPGPAPALAHTHAQSQMGGIHPYHMGHSLAHTPMYDNAQENLDHTRVHHPSYGNDRPGSRIADGGAQNALS